MIDYEVWPEGQSDLKKRIKASDVVDAADSYAFEYGHPNEANDTFVVRVRRVNANRSTKVRIWINYEPVYRAVRVGDPREFT